MLPNTRLAPSVRSPWPYRIALVLAVLMFGLIFLGGLVTTQDAGMAVPDWPGTYGYNMFAYPLATWIYGPVDLFIEHGHRLLASVVGLLAIVSCIVVWRTQVPRWICWVNGVLLLAIIAQGLLGGMRVLFDARTLAMIHGCAGPLVFALACAVVLFLSESWREASEIGESFEGGVWLPRLLWLQTLVVVVQLFIGAQLRHTHAGTTPPAFMGLVHTHLTFAIVAAVLIVATTILCQRRTAGSQTRAAVAIRRTSAFLAGLIAVQLLLGCATWICNYAVPWSDLTPWLAKYTIATKGYWEAWITTGHQATGSLIIAFSFLLALRVHRTRNAGLVSEKDEGLKR